MRTKAFAKKRMMFIQKEDYNFLSYLLIIILKGLGCTSEDKKFKDFRKIAYLVDFVNSGGKLEDYNKEELAKIYSKSQLKKQLLSHLLIVLKNRQFIEVQVNSVHGSFDLWLREDSVPKDFFQHDMFKTEISNLEYLKKQVRLLSKVTVKYLVDQLFTSRNVITWEI